MQNYCFECGVEVFDKLRRQSCTNPPFSLVFFCPNCAKLIEYSEAVDCASRNGVFASDKSYSPTSRICPHPPVIKITIDNSKVLSKECLCGIYRTECFYHRE